MDTRLALLAAGMAVDRIFGDPRPLYRAVPHPVVLLGRVIDRLERRLNDPALDGAARRSRGVLALALLIGLCLFVGTIIHFAADWITLGWVLEIVAIGVLLAHGSLMTHGEEVASALERDGVDAARASVGRMVGRDTAGLETSDICRAAIESLGENFSDGVVAPLLWYWIGGLPGLIAYKAVNTADSMIGYRSSRYAEFGWAAARLDDLANIVPARMSAALIAVAGPDFWSTWRCARTEGTRHKSPNAGWPEAALASALGIALGGPRSYDGVALDGAWLNSSGSKIANPDTIRQAISLLNRAWTLAFGIVVMGAIGIWLW